MGVKILLILILLVFCGCRQSADDKIRKQYERKKNESP